MLARCPLLSRACFLLPTMALLCSAPASTQAPEANHVWKRYMNARFDYAICFPQDLLSPQPEPTNGDGRAFTGKDGAKLTVYGSNNALNESPDDLLKDTTSRLAGNTGKVTYHVVKAHWFVLSGANNGTVFYVKEFFTKDETKAFELTYPADKAPTYNAVASHIAGCFTNTKPGP